MSLYQNKIKQNEIIRKSKINGSEINRFSV